MPGPHVFGDGRLSCWVNTPANLNTGRMSGLRALGITDLLLRGSDGTPVLKQKILAAGFTGCGAYWAVDDLPAAEYAARALADIQRWQPGFGDLNIELANDPPLEPYMRQAVTGIRIMKQNYRLRLVIAPRKGGFVPVDLLQGDPNLFVAIENYGGNMDIIYSMADQERMLRQAGVPDEKIATCYAGACTVGGVTGAQRVNCFPLGWTPQRGVVFTDDLLAEAGLL